MIVLVLKSQIEFHTKRLEFQMLQLQKMHMNKYIR